MAVRWTGVGEMRSQLARLRVGTPRQVGAALYAEGWGIMTDSKTQVPVDLGTLRASGTVLQPEHTAGKVTVTIGYGGPAQAYALVQHERADYQHRVGKAKYLEDPAKAAAPGFAARIAARVRRMIG